MSILKLNLKTYGPLRIATVLQSLGLPRPTTILPRGGELPPETCLDSASCGRLAGLGCPTYSFSQNSVRKSCLGQMI